MVKAFAEGLIAGVSQILTYSESCLLRLLDLSTHRLLDLSTHIDTSSPCDQIFRHDSGCDSIPAIEVTSEDVGRKWRSIVIRSLQSRQTRSMEGYAGQKCMCLAVSIAVIRMWHSLEPQFGRWERL